MLSSSLRAVIIVVIAAVAAHGDVVYVYEKWYC